MAEIEQLAISPRRRFHAGRGGHAPGHLRDWLTTYIETGHLDDEMVEQGRTLDWLLGQLWNCRDCLPGWVADELDLEGGRSYACAARAIKARQRLLKDTR